jgi:4-hydroxy-2-oxoheptanedioate aldolase
MRELREILDGDGVAVNGWLTVESPYLAETLSHCGFDSITVDVQHGMFDLGGAIALLQGVALGDAVPLARTPSLDASVIGKLLDAGAQGIICPGVDTAAEAAELVAMCAYPPRGIRSFGPARANLAARDDYAQTARPMTWAMVESAPAMENLEEIVRVDGLDAVFVGPNDLALALGAAPGTVDPPAVVLEALHRIVTAAHEERIWAGVFCSNGTVARRMAGLGFDLVTPGGETALVRAAALREIALSRGAAATLPDTGGY